LGARLAYYWISIALLIPGQSFGKASSAFKKVSSPSLLGQDDDSLKIVSHYW